jgi:hypothetical protein
MSAFMVSETHVNAPISVALWGPSGQGVAPGHWHRPRWYTVPPTAKMDFAAVQQINRTIDIHTCHEVGQMLVDANVRSLRCRYGAAAARMIPEWTTAYRYRASPFGTRPTAVEGLKLIACYRYQSCKCADWEQSEAHRFCQSLEHSLIACLPGYDAAPWVWKG